MVFEELSKQEKYKLIEWIKNLPDSEKYEYELNTLKQECKYLKEDNDRLEEKISHITEFIRGNIQ